MEITRPTDNLFLKALIFGPSGHGKTTLLGTAQQDPRTTPCLFLDFEGGTSSLSGLDIDVVKIRSWQDYNEVYESLRAGEGAYRSVALDSISETHTFALLTLLEQDSKRKIPDLLEMGDYGRAGTQMRRLLRHFRDLPLHVFFSALAKDDVDPREGTVKKPALAGQLADEVPGMVDVVGYLALATDEEGATSRLLLLRNYPRIRCKVRSGWGKEVPDHIESPTVTSLLDTVLA